MNDRPVNILVRYLDTPVGELVLGSLGDRLCLCDWRYRARRTQVDERLKRFFQADFEEGSSGVTDLAASQVMDYFNRKIQKFNVPLAFAGTDFQIAVWNEIMKIPYGSVISYLELARLAGRPDAVRAVANINGQNALALMVPCHRVVGSNGRLTGYSGGLQAKKQLLGLEGATSQMEPTLFPL